MGTNNKVDSVANNQNTAQNHKLDGYSRFSEVQVLGNKTNMS